MGYGEGGKIGVQTGELKETLRNQPEKIYQRVLVGGSPDKGAGIRLTLRNTKLQPEVSQNLLHILCFFMSNDLIHQHHSL